MGDAAKDMSGQRFGRLTVVRRHGTKLTGTQKLATWTCKCDCGRLRNVPGRNLRRGDTRSCGVSCRLGHARKTKWTIGRVHGRLTVTDVKSIKGRTVLVCACACGRNVTVPAHEVWSRKSCGCLRAPDPPKYTTGQHFGILEILSVGDYTRHGYRYETLCHGCDRKFMRLEKNLAQSQSCHACSRASPLSALCAKSGISHATASYRMKKLGWGLEAACTVPLHAKVK